MVTQIENNDESSRMASKRAAGRTRRNGRANAAPAAAKPRAKRNGAARATNARTEDIDELEKVIRGLEEQLRQLTSGQAIRSTIHSATDQVGQAVSQASTHVGDVVAETLTQMAGRFFNGAQTVTGAARVGTSAMHRIGNELERRPFMTVALALGIGFLAGLAGRRDQA